MIDVKREDRAVVGSGRVSRACPAAMVVAAGVRPAIRLTSNGWTATAVKRVVTSTKKNRSTLGGLGVLALRLDQSATAKSATGLGAGAIYAAEESSRDGGL